MKIGLNRKTSLLGIIVLLLCAFLITSCSNKDSTNDNDGGVITPGESEGNQGSGNTGDSNDETQNSGSDHTHVWDEWYVLKGAMCTELGTKTRSCTVENCGQTQSADIPYIGHSFVDYEAKAPTCTEDGWNAYKECTTCGYSTYSVAPALGHGYDNGVITVSPTCTQTGIRTYTCSRRGCEKSYDTEAEKLGHDWGSWYVTKEVTCTSSGQEQRICFNDPTHVDNRGVTKLGHDWSEYSIIKNATCTEEGIKKRICGNDGLHEETVTIPLISHDVVKDTGICNLCKQIINDPLATPEISTFSNYRIFWNEVAGAGRYQITIIYNGTDITEETTELSFDLEEYFKECNSLEVKLRAMPPEGSTTPHSDYYHETYSIEEGSIVNYEGVGKTVNLLKDHYTKYGNGTHSIFNQYLFNRLMAGDETSVKDQSKKTIYTESIGEYTAQIMLNIGGKIKNSASVGLPELLKVTCGYSFDVGSSFEKKTYHKTRAVFYDDYYTYYGYQAGIDGFNDPDVLYSLLSEEFLADAKALENGEITPEEFVEKYGTHVITAGVYGAEFQVHYETITTDTDFQNQLGLNAQINIASGLEALLEGITLGAGNEVEGKLDSKYFISASGNNTTTTFWFNAIGGTHVAPSIGLNDFSSMSREWADSMKNRDDYALIDVPDGSLYFIWEFLGDEYSVAKEMLYSYFYTVCEEQNKALEDKINDMFIDYYEFDKDTGTLILDFSGCQTVDGASLTDVLYTDGSTVIFNGETGEMNLYSKINGYDVKKIIIKGAYGTRDKNGQFIENFFDGVHITFGKDWTSDNKIDVEFRNFAFHAPEGYAALDFSNAGAKEILITLVGKNEFVGGDGSGETVDGNATINATGKQITLAGDGELIIQAGVGGVGKMGGTPSKDGSANGGAGKQGAMGGIGIIADTVTFSDNVTVDIYGGTGGRGGKGGNSVNKYWGSKNSGGKGGTGGTGGLAISATTINVDESTKITVTGGNGGKGGKGGYTDTRYTNGTLASGGDPGSAGEALLTDTVVNGSLTIQSGEAGGEGNKGRVWYTPDDYGREVFWKNE